MEEDLKEGIEAMRRDKLLSVVIPAYSEEEVLPEFHKRLSGVLKTPDLGAEIIYVNDGSQDGTLAIMRHLREAKPG